MRTRGRASHQQIQNGHTHGHAIGDLLEHRRARAIGNIGRNFRAAIDGTRMKNQRVWLGEFHARGIELVEQDVIVLRERGLMQALGLNAKHDDDVGIFERFFHAIDAADRRARRSDMLEFAGNPHRCPHSVKRQPNLPSR